MGVFEITQLNRGDAAFPQVLQTIPGPPDILWVTGELDEILARPRVAIVGSRKVSTYGKAITQQLAGALAGSGVVVVSGLALGVDSLAHRAAVEAGGLTLAVLPGSISDIYPRSHMGLARQIAQSGGALVSEYGAASRIYASNFIERNRLVAGFANLVLVTEAAAKSGTLHTARFALEQGKDVLAVPGPISSSTSVGTNQLIKSGAGIVTNITDIFDALGIQPVKKHVPRSDNPHEQLIIDLVAQDIHEASELLERSQLSVQAFNQALTMLEITGSIRALGNNQWALH